MATRSIRITNNSAVQRTFFIYAGAPAVAGGGGGAGLRQIVFHSIAIPSGGSAAFTFARELHASCGNGVLVDGQLANLTHTLPSKVIVPYPPGSTFTLAANNNNPQLTEIPDNDLKENNVAPAGAFRVLTGVDFNQGTNIWIGIGGRGTGPNGVVAMDSAVIPIAAFPANPNAVFNITPSERYFCVAGEQQPGCVLDASILPPGPGAIKMLDFAALINVANQLLSAKYNANGTWED